MAAENPQLDVNHWLYRFIAIVIDAIIIGIIAWVIYNLAIAPAIWPRTTTLFGITYSNEPWWTSFTLYPLIQGVIFLLYAAILDVSWGATVGKRLLGLHVQMENGSKIDFAKAFIRNISKIYWLFLLLDWIIGIATPGVDHRQKYTDRMAGTTVVSLKQAFSSGMPPPPPPPPPT